MEPDIVFMYGGKQYSVSYRAYDLNRIVLPDGHVIAPRAWLESYPPQPEGLHEVPNLFSGGSPEEIARLMNGVVAEIV